jgi:hypothetical protein
VAKEYKRGKILEVFKERGEKSLGVIIKDHEIGEFSIPFSGRREILKNLKAGDEIVYRTDRDYNITELFILAYKED